MPKAVELTDAEKARQALHEDRVSPNVARINKKLDEKLWILYHAKDYALGVLQLLESMHLLRDVEAERKAEEDRIAQLRVFGAALTDREDAYRQLICQVAAWSGMPGAYERLELIEKARDDKEYRQLAREFESGEFPRLVEEWREDRRLTAEVALQRVAALLDPRRKTVPMQALRDALNPPADTAEGSR
jgi:hypothetical protein